MITYTVSGSFDRSMRFLKTVEKLDILSIMQSCGKEGVSALASATPKETGRTASSWGYTASKKGNVYEIVWTNSDIENGFPVAIMLQYGHGTGTGGYIQGQDFINPAIRPVFDKIANTIWKVVTSA